LVIGEYVFAKEDQPEWTDKIEFDKD